MQQDSKKYFIDQARSFILNGSDAETPKMACEKDKKRGRDLSIAITAPSPTNYPN